MLIQSDEAMTSLFVDFKIADDKTLIARDISILYIMIIIRAHLLKTADAAALPSQGFHKTKICWPCFVLQKAMNGLIPLPSRTLYPCINFTSLVLLLFY
jgi:hypothetical protein